MLDFLAYDENSIDTNNLTPVLLEKLTNSHRLLLITGISNSGKTVLAESLTAAYSEWSKSQGQSIRYSRRIFRRYDECHRSEATTFVDFARAHLSKHSENVPMENEPTEAVLSAFISHLEKENCWIIIQNLEQIVNFDRKKGMCFKDRNWVIFFEMLLSLPSCNSRVILTSRVLLSEVSNLGADHPELFYEQTMPKWTKQENTQFFRNVIKIPWTQEAENAIEYFFETFEGHPSVLSGIACEIADKPYNGHIVAYYNHEKKKIDKIRDCKPTPYNIPKIVWHRILIEETLEALFKESPYAYHLLCETSVYRSPVSKDMWLDHLEDYGITNKEAETALECLRVYLLVEGDDSNLRQQNLVRYFAKKYLDFPKASTSNT